MKAPSEEIYTANQPLCDFLLVVNSNHGCIAYRLRDIFAYTVELKNGIFRSHIVIADPLANERPTIST